MVKYSDMSICVGWYQSVCFFSMSGQLGKGKEEGVTPSSSGLSETDQEGGVSNSLFPSSSHFLIRHQWEQAQIR